LIQSCRTQVW